MEESNSIFMGIFGVVFIVAWITAVVSWFRMVTARDRKTYWKSIALFVGPILLVFVFAELGGLFPETNFENQPKIERPMIDRPELNELFGAMPLLQKILLGAAGATWLIGGNLLFITHNRRTNKRWWHLLNPLNPPFKDFNGKEWLILVCLVVITMALSMAAISQNPPVLQPSLNKHSQQDTASGVPLL